MRPRSPHRLLDHVRRMVLAVCLVLAVGARAQYVNFESAQMRTLDFAQRKKYFDEVQAILAEELPMIYTVSPFHFAAVRSDLANVRPSVLTPYRVTWNVQELYFKKP